MNCWRTCIVVCLFGRKSFEVQWKHFNEIFKSFFFLNIGFQLRGKVVTPKTYVFMYLHILLFHMSYLLLMRNTVKLVAGSSCYSISTLWTFVKIILPTTVCSIYFHSKQIFSLLDIFSCDTHFKGNTSFFAAFIASCFGKYSLFPKLTILLHIQPLPRFYLFIAVSLKTKVQ